MKKSAYQFLIENKENEILLQTIYKRLSEHLSLDINEIAKESFISKSGITRYFTTHGFDGFKEFKYILLNEDQSFDNTISKEEIEDEIMFKPIQITSSLNEEKTYLDLIKKIKTANTIYIHAIGGNNSVAYELQTRLERFGFKTTFTTDTHLMYVKIMNAKENDLLIVLSYSGETKETLKIAKAAKERNITIASITRKSENSLSKLSDIQLYTDSSDSVVKIMALKSRTSMFYIVFKLTILIYSSDIKKYNSILKNNIY
ncbi:MurR/RpiR family transcriptional regulator [Spiroplasma endosymbiont of Othius punctulatus]|uniref:MurR/RpiR family transcriptional regulator n=1 Tax=Spiroplasma endosymbiont of Othius punctulatus TaxID=3066289 RepID=UPI0030CF7564